MNKLTLNGFLKEVVRKIIHVTIAFVPLMADQNLYITVALLCAGILFYIVRENERLQGKSRGLVSRLTIMASRPAEQGFVWGPVSLGIGALSALLYYPNPAAATAIYALAFGDSIASIVGKLWGRRRWYWIGERTILGSLSCFLVVTISSFAVLGNIGLSLLAAAVATVLELFSSNEIDNIIIPLGTGLVLYIIL